MGSNRKLLFGGLLVVAAIIFWGLISAISRWNSRTGLPATRVASNAAATNVAAPAKSMIAKATMDIPAGSIMTREMFQMVPATGGATGYLTDPATQGVGYITRVKIAKNTNFRPDEDFVGHISEVGIAGALGVGTRAMVIPLANKPTLHDLVHIGNFVDVNAAFDGQEARTIVQNVRVLAVDVFGSDFPQTNIAARGPYKADLKGSGAGIAAPATATDGTTIPAGTAPTATPAPAQAPPRPDAAITLEVTPEQANTILLAQASSATIDFVVRPVIAGGITPEVPVIDPATGLPIGGSGPDSGQIRAVSVTKRQIAPYAESRKNPGGATSNRGAGGVRTASASSERPTRGRGGNFDAPPLGGGFARPNPTFPPPTGGGNENQTPVIIPQSPTYEIPIISDGRTVRIETVRRPQEPSQP